MLIYLCQVTSPPPPNEQYTNTTHHEVVAGEVEGDKGGQRGEGRALQGTCR